MNPRASLLVVVALATFLAASAVQPAMAQNWNVDQMEVWSRVQNCLGYIYGNNFEAGRACVHDDFSGWLYGEPVPRTKDHFDTITRYFMENRQVATYDLRPLAILVSGDLAVVHYMEFSIDQGSMEVESGRWTDVLVKEDGAWYWIADHGGSMPEGDD